MVSKDGWQDNAQQQRRLARHFVAANTMSFVLLAAACSLRWSTSDVARSHIFVSATIVIVCFTMATIIWTYAHGRRHINALCVAAYVSTALLVLLPMSLLVLLDKAYAVVTIPLFPVAICIFLLLRKGAHIGFASGTARYEQLDHNLSCLFHLAAGITVPSYAGLIGHIVSTVRGTSSPQEGIGVNAVECLLLYSVVIGLVLMLLSSSPPPLYLRKTRVVVVSRFLGLLADVLVGLVALAGFLQATETAGGYAVLAFTTTTIAGCAIFAREHEDEPDRHGEHDIKQHLDSSSPPSLVLLMVYSCSFTLLMASYSMGRATRRHAAASYWTMIGVVVAASFVISSLCQIALQRRAPRTESMLCCITMFRKVHNVSLAIVVAFSVIMSVDKLAKAIAYLQEILVSLL
ncbi:hypothetical protein GQ55_8G165000 [Panicum hallii var. hallii]|uniref:Uncharacterized protein n=1 Tax=Panicum hallii var. hallii TaxID=1504633 RepID=A0A2T7CNC7_9POAL|nr:hypothetical protein GQ55_8G165000 [Panicum hallii var. hallii]